MCICDIQASRNETDVHIPRSSAMYRRRMEAVSVWCAAGSGGFADPLLPPQLPLPPAGRGLGVLVVLCCCMVLSREKCAAESKGREREPMAP